MHLRILAVALCCFSLTGELAAVARHVQPVPEEERIWQTFVDWFRSRPPSGNRRELVEPYRKQLAQTGLSEADVNQQMSVVWSGVFRRPDGVKLLWNKVYAGGKPIFTHEPNALLQQTIHARTPGKALDIGMGQGRNAIFLALNGWAVTGFDPSDEGVRQARANADRLGIALDARVARDDEFDFGREQWDLIVMTYVRALTAEDARCFWQALRPGGIVVYENAAGGNEALNAFLRFRIVRWEDVVDTPDWNPDNENIRIQRLVAEKPYQ